MNLSAGWKREWTTIAGLAAILRLVYAAIGWSVAAGPAPSPLASGAVYDFTRPLQSAGFFAEHLVNVWWRWDTPYYLAIAAQGYLIERTRAFLPLYPLLIRWLSPLAAGDGLAAALAISAVCAVAAGILLYEVALQESWSAPDALRAVISFFLFPTAFFLFAGYTEALFLALSLAAWLLARRGRWALAGLAAGLAALTRLAGVLLTPVLIWIYLAQCANAHGLGFVAQLRLIRSHGLRCLAQPAWLWTLLPAAALSVYLFLARRASSDVLETYWGIQTVAPWEGIRLLVQRLIWTPRVFMDWIDLSLFMLVVTLCIYGLRRQDPALSIYSWLNLTLLMMRGTPPHLLDSFSRYMLVIFPAFLLLPRALPPRLLAVCWALALVLQLILASGFLQWRWVA